MEPAYVIVLSAMFGGAGAYLGAYLRQKGQNVATKEDLAEITRRQEEIKAELADRSHFSHIRYEREVALYRTLWQNLSEYFEQSAFAFRWNMNPDQADKAVVSSRAWQETGSRLFKTIRDNRPFYPQEVWTELTKLHDLCNDLARTQQYMTPSVSPSDRKDCDRILEAAKRQLRLVENLI